MACGCPVIAFGKGSIPEIIENGKTGFVVTNSHEAIQAISKISQINRQYCRHYSLTRFSVKRMADEYEMIYKTVLQEQKTKHSAGYVSHGFSTSHIHKNNDDLI
jgi:glycosyltransferase involved in cell wall biosynthesis